MTDEPTVEPTATEPMTLRSRSQALHAKYGNYYPAVFFITGFVIDVATLSRIDDPWTIATQAAYLAVIAAYVRLEMLDTLAPVRPPRWCSWLWTYREEIVHFLFGSLLSVYTLFYLKSSSLIASGAFLALLVTLMLANEFSRFQQSGALMRISLLTLCLISYFGYVIPVLAGFAGLVPFLLSLAVSTGLMLALERSVRGRVRGETAPAAETEATPRGWRRKLNEWRRRPLDERARHASLTVATAFLVLYVLQLVPPVPLSAQYMGIYHQIEKRDDAYVLSYHRPWWKKWQNGAQTFLSRPGDRVYVFARVFSPARFKDEIRVRWLYKNERGGWESSDAIPIQISGGRDEGFRGFAYKQNFQPGSWRVRLETTDGREIGRIGFTVVPDESGDERMMETDVF